MYRCGSLQNVLQSSFVTFVEGETCLSLSPAMSFLTTAGFGKSPQCLISCFTPPSLLSPFLSPHRLLLLPPLRLSRACRQSLRFGAVLLQPTLQLRLQNHLFSIRSQREWMDGGRERGLIFFSSLVRRYSKRQVFNVVDQLTCYGSPAALLSVYTDQPQH